MKKFLILILLVVVNFCAVYAQSLPASFANLKSSNLTDAQLNNIVQQMNGAGYKPEQFFELGVARGMNPAEAKVVQERVTRLQGNTNGAVADTNTQRKAEIEATSLKEVNNSLKLYGAEIFSNGNLTFEPNLRIATPLNYIVGPDDEIVVIISGYQEFNGRFKVSPEGFINIPGSGIIYVAGLTFEEVSNQIKSKLTANGYANIRTGLTKINITLGAIRSIKVTLIGEVVKPGSYTIPSLATVFNALYASGGPSENGSFRNIEIIRNNTVIGKFDIYDFLSKGDLSKNMMLADQDIIRIPTYIKRVSLRGAFKRQGIYEVAIGETLQDVIKFAGGFTDDAATDFISAVQLTSSQRKITDIQSKDFGIFIPNNADQYSIGKIQDKYENRVQVDGAIVSPGIYAWREGLTLKDLIEKAKGVRDEAYLAQGFIKRVRQDNTPVAVSFNVADVIGGRSNMLLQKEDAVTILSTFDLKENYKVSIEGAVAKSGDFPYIDSLTLQDVVLQAGGLQITADNKIEISRRTKKANPMDPKAEISEILEITYDSSFFKGGNNVKLEPFDRILVKSNPSFVLPQQVVVRGEVLYPGSYTMLSKSEPASSLISRSGGLLPTANSGSAYLLRLKDNATETERRRHLENLISDDSKEVYITYDMLGAYDKFVLDLNDLKQHRGTVQDVILKPGDVLVVNQLNNDVKVSGQVFNPNISVYESGKSLNYYVNRAGGFAPNSKKGNTLVFYPNGETQKVKHFLFFKSNPRIEPGSEIIVPKEKSLVKKGLTTADILAVTGSAISVASVVIALLNFVK